MALAKLTHGGTSAKRQPRGTLCVSYFCSQQMARIEAQNVYLWCLCHTKGQANNMKFCPSIELLEEGWVVTDAFSCVEKSRVHEQSRRVRHGSRADTSGIAILVGHPTTP